MAAAAVELGRAAQLCVFILGTQYLNLSVLMGVFGVRYAAYVLVITLAELCLTLKLTTHLGPEPGENDIDDSERNRQKNQQEHHRHSQNYTPKTRKDGTTTRPLFTGFP